MFYEELMKSKHCINKNDRIIIGVSSGPDSMGLLHFLISIQSEFNLTLYVAHINHHTRVNENDIEEVLIKDYCQKNHVSIHVGNFKKSGKKNFHEEAREYRYDFFKKLSKELNANKIALAHHEDDQVETILFKITRGSNISGYLGMKESVEVDDNIQIIRPFLHVPKNIIVNYCEENGVPYAIDSSNLSNKYTRNYIRNEIIPHFKNIQHDFNQKIMQFHEQLEEVDDFLKQNAKILIKEMIISSEKDRIILDLNKLRKTHKAILREILLSVVNEIYLDSFDFSYEKMRNIFNIINNDKPNIVFNLGKGLYCVKEYDKITFEIGQKNYLGYKVDIDTFKGYKLPNGMSISVKKVEEKAKIHNKNMILCYNSTIWPLVIRTKETGDYIKTKIGKKKVNRIFIDAKIPVNLRKTWPLLVDKNGDILWVIGLQKAELDLSLSDQKILIEVY